MTFLMDAALAANWMTNWFMATKINKTAQGVDGMGTVNHEVVIATTWSKDHALHVRQWVSKLPDKWQPLFCMAISVVNGFVTIVLTPDGSKKGWETADEGDVLRAEFIKLMQSFAYEDGSNPFRWVEVGYGEYGQKVLQGNNENCFNDLPYATDTPTTQGARDE